MTETKVCTACGKTNNSNATVCEFCNTPFAALAVASSQTTSHIPPPPPNKQFTPERVVQLTRLYSDIIVFQIANHEQPILVKVSGDIVTLGRYSPGEKPPTVDLTPFNGTLMGVSRQHAMIIKDDEGYKLKDLSSTNGTWLNETRLNANQLYPIQSGDIIRFGQINTSVYFRLAETNNTAETSLILLSDIESSVPLRLTSSVIENVLLPYLKALNGFQKACDKIMAQPINEMTIASITMDASKPMLTIKVSGLYQAYRLLKNNILRWREMHLETIIKLNQPTVGAYKEWSADELIVTEQPTTDHSTSEQPATKQPTDELPITERPTSEQPVTEQAAKRIAAQPDENLSKAGIELVSEILADLAPQRSNEENKAHLATMLPSLQQLALSPLRLTDNPP